MRWRGGGVEKERNEEARDSGGGREGVWLTRGNSFCR